MLRSIHSEIRKVLTTRIWWILALILFGYIALVAAGMAALFAFASDQLTEQGGQGIPEEGIPPLIYSLTTAFGYVFPVLFGALATTGEFRHQTLTPTFLATPRRSTVLGGKVVTAVVFGVVYAVVGSLGAVGLGGIVIAATGHDPLLGASDTWALLGRVVIAMVLWAVIGVGLGVLVPNQVAVIVIVLAFTQFVEPLLRTAAAFWEWSAAVGRFLPGAAGDALVGSSIFSALTGGSAVQPLEWWQGGLVLAGYAALFLVAGAATTWRRDVT
ncbi:ABC transporter permease [Protaetiibacter intestinalis]|uniref:ABC transporter permease n=1 Tax=Protaetiibacter intestinalis TaxID=2419774 RepID=A0A387B8R7_9MICO|nr:ABC transporter permease [Protaetiibacter intestinalis]AYF98757.1 ABC transporter permease [Protaetiibacter intestinalis]